MMCRPSPFDARCGYRLSAAVVHVRLANAMHMRLTSEQADVRRFVFILCMSVVCVCVCVVVPLTQLQHSRIRTRKHSITINQFVLSRSDKIERQFYFHTRGSVGLNFRLEWLIQLVRMMCARPFSALPFANAKYTDNNNNNREGVVCW